MLMQPTYGLHMSQWQGGMIRPTLSPSSSLQADVTLPILLLVSRCCVEQYAAAVVSYQRITADKEVCIFAMHSEQNQANKQHGVPSRALF